MSKKKELTRDEIIDALRVKRINLHDLKCESEEKVTEYQVEIDILDRVMDDLEKLQEVI